MIKRLRAALSALLRYHSEDEFGVPFPREYWTPGYREAVEEAERLIEEAKNASAAFAQQQERKRCAKLLDISRSEACLLAGEMTAQEWRTVAAVLAALTSRMLRGD